jgi:hypothetical protein
MRSAWFGGAHMKYAVFFNSDVSASDITSLPILSSFYYSSVLYILKNDGKQEIYRAHPFNKQGQAFTQVSFFNSSLSKKQEDSFYPDLFNVG